jgi:hypothetical protein
VKGAIIEIAADPFAQVSLKPPGLILLYIGCTALLGPGLSLSRENW